MKAPTFSLFRRLLCLAVCGLASIHGAFALSDENIPFTVSRAQRALGEVAVLAWQSVPGASYRVQYATVLSPAAAWRDFDVVTAESTTSTAEVPLALAGDFSRLFFRLVLPQPAISSVEPSLLRTAGGTFYVVGQCFPPGSIVHLNGEPASITTVIDPTTLEVIFSPLAVGVYDVTVVNSAGSVLASLEDALRITNGIPFETLEPPSLPPGAPRRLRAGKNQDIEVENDETHWVGHDRIVGVTAAGEACVSSVDLRIPGRGLDFIWGTTYRSRNGDGSSTLGDLWSHSYDIRCAQNFGHIEVWDGTGRHDTFFLQADGSFARRGFFRRGTLAGNVFTLEFADKGRWVFRPLDGSPASGKIARSIDRNGNELQFAYNAAGFLTTIMDTLSRPIQVQYGANNRMSAVVDFTGRTVRYEYFGLNDPGGPQGTLASITSAAVTGTPTANDFPLGKTRRFTYITGISDPRLNTNLLTITDPAGQTWCRFRYAPATNQLDVSFDRVVSLQLGDAANQIDQPAMFTWIAQTPEPANRFAMVKLIANDAVGNVSEFIYDSRNRLLRKREFTGRATPGVPVTETTNLPGAPLRPSDPAFFETLASWNLDFRPRRFTLPRGNALAFVWESDFDADAAPSDAGNLRTMRELSTTGEVHPWRLIHHPSRGTHEGNQRILNFPAVRTAIQDFEKNTEAVSGGFGLIGPPPVADFEKNTENVSGGFGLMAPQGAPATVSKLMEEEGIFYFITANPPTAPLVAPPEPEVPFSPPGRAYFEPTRPLVGGTITYPPLVGGTQEFDDFRFNFPPDDDLMLIHPRRRNDGIWPSSPEAMNDFPLDVDLSPPGHGLGPGPFVTAPYRESDFDFGLDDDDGPDFLNQLSFGQRTPPPADALPPASRLELPFHAPESVLDPLGRLSKIFIDGEGNVTTIERLGPSVSDDFMFNGAGQVIEHVHPANGSGHRRRDTFTYFGAGPQMGYLEGITIDSGGHNLQTHYEYDNRGNLVRLVDARGHDTLITRNQLNEVVRIHSPVINTPGGPVRYQRDYIYDPNGNVVRIDVENRDENGALGVPAELSSTFAYDFRNRLRSRTETVDNNETITIHGFYDGNSNLARLMSPEAASGNDVANVVLFRHDERDLLFQMTRAPASADQATSQFDYNPNRRLTAHHQGLENNPLETRTEYDAFDRRVRRIDAAENQTAFTYDDAGNVIGIRVIGNAEPVGPGPPPPPRLLFAGDYGYNALNRLVSSRLGFFHPVTGEVFGDGARSTIVDRAPNQQIRTLTNDGGHVTSYAYDTVNRLSRMTDARGNQAEFSYDPNHNPTALLLTDKRDSGAPDEQFRMTFIYDPLNRLDRREDNVGNATTYRYDSRGHRTRQVDPRGAITGFEYDGLGRLVRRVQDMDATGTETLPDISRSFQYNANSRLTRRIDDNGNATLYRYDSLNRLIGIDYADGTSRARAYDVHHNLITSQDANGTVVTHTYDVLNRLTQKQVVPGSGVAATTTFERYAYDGMSRLLRAQNDDSVVTFTYDSLGDLLSEVAGGFATRSAYNALGQRVSLLYPGSRLLGYTYDALGRVTSVTDGPTTLASFLYAGRRRLERADHGNGTRVALTYGGQVGVVGTDHAWGRVAALQHIRIASGQIIHDLANTWDRNQNKVGRRQLTPFTPGGPAQTRQFDYDDANRLVHSLVTSSGGPLLDTQYQLDGEGNRVQIIGGLNPGAYLRDPTLPSPADFQVNQYTQTPFDGRQYDENGNLRQTNPTSPSGHSRQMTYDYANRAVHVFIAGGTSVQYRYDALGRRIAKVVAPPGPPIVFETTFVFDRGREIEERDGIGTLQSEFAFGDRIPIGESESWWFATMRRGGLEFWLHADDVGNVLALTNAAGAPVERYDYDDYGQVTFLDPAGNPIAGSTQSAAGNPYLARAERYDAELRFYHRRRTTPRPVLADPQSGVVVGPPGEEIYPDKYSRIKVQFHWDREGKKDSNTNCWK